MPFYPVGVGGGISGNVIRIIADSGFIGQTYTIKDANNNVLKTGTIPASGTKDVTILENGRIKVECNNTTKIINIPNEFGLYKVKLSTNVNYTVVIHKLRKNIDEAVCTYENDAKDMIPSHMDYSTGLFDYGSWENAFFMPKPCMVRTDGTVDYYLDPDNYTKKLDGSASDISDENYDGNAFVEVPHMWVKVIDSDNKIYINIANYKVDSSYVDWPFHDRNGNSAPYIYWSIYEISKSTIGNIARSLSGKTILIGSSISVTNMQTYTRANGIDYDIQTYSSYLLREYLCTLISCSTNSQKSFGRGIADASSATPSTGTMNTKGLFWGSDSGTDGVKVFGIENLWGNHYKRMLGVGSIVNVMRYKLTRGTEDGSSISDYITSGNFGSNYLIGPALSGSSGAYPSSFVVNNNFALQPVSITIGSSYISDATIPDAVGFTIDSNTIAYGTSSYYYSQGDRCGIFSLSNANNSNGSNYITSYLNLIPAVE